MDRDYWLLGAVAMVLAGILLMPTFYTVKRKFRRWRLMRKVGHIYKENF